MMGAEHARGHHEVPAYLGRDRRKPVRIPHPATPVALVEDHIAQCATLKKFQQLTPGEVAGPAAFYCKTRLSVDIHKKWAR